MSKSNKKSINWLVEEFTSIDLVPAIQASEIKSSVTETTLEEGGKKHTFKSSQTQNNAEGRPVSLKNFGEKGELLEEYKYHYEKGMQRIELFESGKKSCIWTYYYNEKGQLAKSEYAETTDDSHDVDSFEYNKEGRLTKVLMDVYPQEVEDEEPATGYELEWDGDKLLSVSEFYGEEEEATIHFEYNDKGQVIAVKKYIYLVDDEDEDVEELIDEQKPKYDEKGRLVENVITYHNSNSQLVMQYIYEGDSEVALKTVHKDYENGKLVRSIEFIEDEQGNLLKSVEQIHKGNLVKTDIFSYTK